MYTIRENVREWEKICNKYEPFDLTHVCVETCILFRQCICYKSGYYNLKPVHQCSYENCKDRLEMVNATEAICPITTQIYVIDLFPAYDDRHKFLHDCRPLVFENENPNNKRLKILPEIPKKIPEQYYVDQCSTTEIMTKLRSEMTNIALSIFNILVRDSIKGEHSSVLLEAVNACIYYYVKLRSFFHPEWSCFITFVIAFIYGGQQTKTAILPTWNMINRCLVPENMLENIPHFRRYKLTPKRNGVNIGKIFNALKKANILFFTNDTKVIFDASVRSWGVNFLKKNKISL